MTFVFNKPVLKRFLKGLGSMLLGLIITGSLSYTNHFLATNPTAFGALTGVIASIVLGVEKSVPNNL